MKFKQTQRLAVTRVSGEDSVGRKLTKDGGQPRALFLLVRHAQFRRAVEWAFCGLKCLTAFFLRVRKGLV